MRAQSKRNRPIRTVMALGLAAAFALAACGSDSKSSGTAAPGGLPLLQAPLERQRPAARSLSR